MFRHIENDALRVLPWCLLLLSGLLQANEAPKKATLTHFSPYPYVGAKVGWMNYQHACEAWSLSCDGDDTAWAGFVGYQINTFVGVEAAWLDLGSAKGIYPEGGVNQSYIGSMTGWEVSLLGRWGVLENLDAFIKGGVLVWDGENRGPRRTDKDSGEAPMAGIGLEYHFAQQWSARLEYQYVDSLGSDKLGGSNGHFTSIGLRYRFGVTPLSAAAPNVTPPTVAALPKSVSHTLASLHLVTLFAFDSSELTDTEPLKTAIARLQRYPSTQVLLKGYTDAKGSDSYNLALSKRRAQAVADYFIRQGISAERIQVEAFGEAFPAVANDSAADRRLNRRVDVFSPAVVIDVDVAPVRQDVNAQ